MSKKSVPKISEDQINQILEYFGDSDEPIISRAYLDGGTQDPSSRLERAAINQMCEGAATFSRYAIWANTVRDHIFHGLKAIDAGEPETARALMVRAINSLSAFSEIQSLMDPDQMGNPMLFQDHKQNR